MSADSKKPPRSPDAFEISKKYSRVLFSMEAHPWVTKHGAEPLPPEDDNCSLIEVTEEEVENSVKHIPSLTTVILVRTMLRKRSFGNPFDLSRKEDRSSLCAPRRTFTKQESADGVKSMDLPYVGEDEALS